ncbi:MAG: O-antigen ligase family protein [Bacillota bacterium]
MSNRIEAVEPENRKSLRKTGKNGDSPAAWIIPALFFAWIYLPPVCLYLVFCLYFGLSIKKAGRTPPANTPFVLALILSAGISFLLLKEKTIGARMSYCYFTANLIVFWLCLSLRERPVRWLKALALGGTAAVFVSFAAALFVPPPAPDIWRDPALKSNPVFRMQGPLANPHFFAEYLIVLFPLVWHFAGQKKGKYWMGAKWLCLLGLLFTFSRTAWAAFLLLLPALPGRREKITAGLVFLGVFLWPVFGERAWSIATGQSGTLQYRLRIWRGALDILQHHVNKLVWGWGPGRFPHLIAETLGHPAALHAHQLFLQILIDYGLAGLALLGALLISAFKPLPRPGAGDPWDLPAYGLLALLFYGLAEHVWFEPHVSLLFWSLLGLYAAGRREGRAGKDG